MPGASVFIDTNVLLYSYDVRDPAKRAEAQTWISALAATQSGAVNLQVLNEMSDVLIRRNWLKGPAAVFAVIDDLAAFGASPIDRRTVSGARAVHRATQYSWWDCILLASALALGCTHFLSEDLQDGQRIAAGGGRGLTIVDPFAHSPQQILAS